MRLVLRRDYYSYKGQYVVCRSCLERIFGTLPDKIEVIFSKTPTEGSTKIGMGKKGVWVNKRCYPVCAFVRWAIGEHGHYMRIEPCS